MGRMWKYALILAALVAPALVPSRANAWTHPREGFGLGIGSGTGATGISAKMMVPPGAFQGVLSQDRAVAILDAVEHGARTHAAVVRATGLSRTTTHRLLKSLVAHGLLEYIGGRGYRLAPSGRASS